MCLQLPITAMLTTDGPRKLARQTPAPGPSLILLNFKIEKIDAQKGPWLSQDHIGRRDSSLGLSHSKSYVVSKPSRRIHTGQHILLHLVRLPSILTHSPRNIINSVVGLMFHSRSDHMTWNLNTGSTGVLGNIHIHKYFAFFHFHPLWKSLETPDCLTSSQDCGVRKPFFWDPEVCWEPIAKASFHLLGSMGDVSGKAWLSRDLLPDSQREGVSSSLTNLWTYF